MESKKELTAAEKSEIFKRLIPRVIDNDAAAIDEFYGIIYDDIYKYVLSVTRDEDIAPDIAQETAIEVHLSLQKLDDHGAFAAWCRTIAYHQCTKYFKKRDKTEDNEVNDSFYAGDEDFSVLDGVADDKAEFIPHEYIENEATKKIIADIVDGLPPAQRAAVYDFYYHKESVADIAAKQGVSTGTIKSRLAYARTKMGDAIREYEKENGIKLHSIAFIPLIRFFFASESAGIVVPTGAASSAVAAITGGSAAAGAATVAATSAAAGGAGVSAGVGASASAGAAVTLGAKLAALPLAAKIIAGGLAASVIIGGTAAVVTNLPEKSDTVADGITSSAESIYDSPSSDDAVSSELTASVSGSESDATDSASDTVTSKGPSDGQALLKEPPIISKDRGYYSDSVYIKSVDSATGEEYYKLYTVAAYFYLDGATLYNEFYEKADYSGNVVKFDLNPSYREYIPIDAGEYHKSDIEYILTWANEALGTSYTWEEYFVSDRAASVETFVEIEGKKYIAFDPPKGGGYAKGPIYSFEKTMSNENFTLTPLAVRDNADAKVYSLKMDHSSEAPYNLEVEVSFKDDVKRTLKMYAMTEAE